MVSENINKIFSLFTAMTVLMHLIPPVCVVTVTTLFQEEGGTV